MVPLGRRLRGDRNCCSDDHGRNDPEPHRSPKHVRDCTIHAGRSAVVPKTKDF